MRRISIRTATSSCHSRVATSFGSKQHRTWQKLSSVAWLTSAIRRFWRANRNIMHDTEMSQSCLNVRWRSENRKMFDKKLDSSIFLNKCLSKFIYFACPNPRTRREGYVGKEEMLNNEAQDYPTWAIRRRLRLRYIHCLMKGDHIHNSNGLFRKAEIF